MRCLFTLGLLITTHALGGFQVFRYLEQRDYIRIGEVMGSPPRRIVFDVVDREGRKGIVELALSSETSFRWLFHVLFQSAGVRMLESYPTMVKIDDPKIIASLSPEWQHEIKKYREAFGDDEGYYVPAFVRYERIRELSIDHVENLSTREVRKADYSKLSQDEQLSRLTDAAKVIIIQYLFNLRNVDRFVMRDQIISNLNATVIDLRNTAHQGKHALRELFAQKFAWQQLVALRPDLQRSFVNEINHFLTQVEHIAESDTWQILKLSDFLSQGPTGRAIVENYQKRVREQSKTLLQDLNDIATHRWRFRGEELRFRTNRDDRGLLVWKIPGSDFNIDEVTNSTAQGHERSLLFRLFMMTPEARFDFEKRQHQRGWPRIKDLLQRARQWDSTTALMGYLDPRDFSDRDQDRVRFDLRNDDKKWLVFVPVNDSESRTILKTLHKIKSTIDITILPLQDAPRPYNLETSVASMILKAAEGRTVILCETLGYEQYAEMFRDAGIPVVIADQHQPDPENWDWRSTAEIVWDVFGYHPTAPELLDAIRDRDGLYGVLKTLTQHGSDPLAPIHERFEAKGSSHVKDPGILEANFEYDAECDLHTCFDGKFLNLASLLTVMTKKHFPHFFQFLKVNHRYATFFGRLELAKELIKIIKKYQGEDEDRIHWYGSGSYGAIVTWKVSHTLKSSDLMRELKEAAKKSEELPCEISFSAK